MEFNSASSSHLFNSSMSPLPVAVAVPIGVTDDKKVECDSAPSAPPLALMSSLLSDKEWEQVGADRFQRLSPRWNEQEKTCRIVSRLFMGVSVLFSVGAAAVGTGLVFSASPYMVLGMTAALVAGAIGSAIAAKVFNPEGKKFLKDPEFLLREVKGAEKDIEENQLSYLEIRNKYKELLDNSFLKGKDLNRLFSLRIADPELSYCDLREQLKAGESSADFSFGFTLDDANQEALRAKVFAPSWEKEASMSKSEIEALMIDPREIAFKVVGRNYSKLINGEILYSLFKGNIENHWRLFQQEQLDAIKPLAIDHYVKSHSSLKDAIRDQTMTPLKITFTDLIKAGALSSDIDRLQENRMGYREFRRRHSFEAICIYQSQAVKGVTSPLEEAYLSSYCNMQEFASDARLFNIDDSEIKERKERKMLQEFESIHSFDEVIAKFGESVFQEKLLTLENSTLRGLIVKHLKKLVSENQANPYQISPSSPLRKYNLIADHIQVMLDNAQKDEKEVLQDYESKRNEFQAERQEKKQRYNSEFNSSIARLLPPLKSQIEECKGRLIELNSQRDRTKSSVNAFEGEARNQEDISSKLKLKESEYRALEENLRWVKPLDLEALLSKQRVLTSKKARASEVKDLLGKVLQIDHFKAEIKRLVSEIAAIDDQLNVEQKVSGVVAALSSMSEKRALQRKKSELTSEKEANEEQLRQALSAKQTEADLKSESANLCHVDSQLTEVKEAVNMAQRQKKAADKKERLLSEISALRNQVKPEPGLVENGFNLFNQVSLASLETQITEIERKVLGLSNSYKEIKTRLETDRDSLNRVAQKSFDENIRKLESERKTQLDQIKENFLAQLR